MCNFSPFSAQIWWPVEGYAPLPGFIVILVPSRSLEVCLPFQGQISLKLAKGGGCVSKLIKCVSCDNLLQRSIQLCILSIHVGMWEPWLPFLTLRKLQSSQSPYNFKLRYYQGKTSFHVSFRQLLIFPSSANTKSKWPFGFIGSFKKKFKNGCLFTYSCVRFLFHKQAIQLWWNKN